MSPPLPSRRRRAGSRRLLGVVAAVLAGAAVAVPASGVGATPSGPPSTLAAGGTLTAGEKLVSPDGHETLVMQSDGNLVEYSGGTRALWSTGTSGERGAHAVMQRAGNLAVYAPDGTALYSSNSRTTGCPRLLVQNDGNVVIYATRAIWAAGVVQSTLLPGDELQSGWSIYSPPPEDLRLTMQGDGNLVLYDGAGRALWSTGTERHPGSHAVMQSDGNFVVYGPEGHALWASHTSRHLGAHLALQSDGNLVVYAGSSPLFASGTRGRATGGSLAPVAPAPVSCASTTTTTTTSTTPTTTTTPPPPPAPVVTTPVTTPVPTPAPVATGIRPLRVRMAISWTWSHAITRLRRVRIGTAPRRTRLTLSCRGRGCPRRHGTLRAHGLRALHRLLARLAGRRFAAGEELLVSLTAPGYRPERVTIRFRSGRVPEVRLLRR